MSRIFIGHSRTHNAEAVALLEWLWNNSWKDEILVDLDRGNGIAAGGRWERALNQAANRCEAVLFLLSRAWLGSKWRLGELNLAHRLNKRLFGVLIEDLGIDELPEDLIRTWQIVRLAASRDRCLLEIAKRHRREPRPALEGRPAGFLGQW